MATRFAFRSRRYRLLRLLGTGGMGRVYLARDLLEGGREVALKVYPSTYGEERLRREFATLRGLHHPGIARAFHFGTNYLDGSAFFTMEYVRGRRLDAFLDRLRASGTARLLETGLSLFRQVAAALGYLHRRGILHLDVKPGNVLVLDLGGASPPQPVLIDFGLVRLPELPRLPVEQGTAPFVAPELFRGEPPGPAYDVYSLGVTFYRAFSGRLPFGGQSGEDFARAHLHATPAPLAGLPASLASLILRLLAKDPRLRFADGAEVAQALSELELPGLPAAAPIAFHAPDFVGRKEEQAAFRRWLDEKTPRRPLLLLEGGAGIGKSRLLERFEMLLELERRPVLFLGALESGGDLLASLLRRSSILFGPPRARDGNLLRSPSSGRPPLEAGGSTAGSAGPELRETMLHQAAGYLARRIATEGLFLLIDDLHAAGAPGKRLILEVARRLAAGHEGGGGEGTAGAGGLAASIGAGSAAAEALRSLLPAPLWLRLGPLSAAECSRIEIAGLEEAVADPARLRSFRARLAEETGGHPLFFIQGLLSLRSGVAADEGLGERLRREIAALDAMSRGILVALTALARPASSTELAAILGKTPPALANGLRALRQAGLLAAAGARERLVHAAVEAAVVSSLAPRELEAAHRLIAARLERSPGSLAEAAHHYFRAGDAKKGLRTSLELLSLVQVSGDGQGRIAAVLLRAAEAARREERRRLLEAAGDLLEAEGRFEECIDAREKAVEAAGPRPLSVKPLRKLACALHRAGRTAEARALLDRCLERLSRRAEPAEALEVLAEKALLCHFAHQGDEALDLARRGLETWRKLAPRRRAALVQPALNLHGILGQIHIRRLESQEALRWLEAGVKLARRSRAQGSTGVLLNNLALAQHLAGLLREALASFRKAEAAARERQDGGALVSILCNIAQIQVKLGRPVAAAETLSKAEEVSAMAQSQRLRLSHAYSHALLWHLLGAPERASWSKVGELARQAGDPFLSGFVALYRAEAAIDAGEVEEARNALGDIEGPPPVQAAARARLAHIEALAGNAGRARELIAGECEAEVVRNLMESWNRVHLGAAALECGDAALARRLLLGAELAFRRSGFALGRLECALQLADASLRLGNLRDAGRWIAAARRLPVEALDGIAPRRRELRATLLEARRLLLGAAKDGGGEALLQVQDLLLRAAGDPSIERCPRVRLELELLEAARRLVSGDAAGARRSGIEARLLERRAAATNGRRERGCRRRDLWSAFGLEAFRPPLGRLALAPAHGAALARVFEALSGETEAAPALASALEEAVSALGGLQGEIAAAGADGGERLVARWPARSKRRGEWGPVLAAPLRFLGEPLGAVRVVLPARAPVRGSQAAFLEACGKAFAPFCARTAPAGAAEDATRALDRTRLLRKGGPPTAFLEGPRGFPGFVAESREMARILRVIARLRDSALSVLITGESGTGKDHVARLIHQSGPRRGGPFVSQNCSAIPAALLEADLFGYQRGAFSGAERTRTGFLFQAQGGTFHLEEVGEIDLAVQARLLRFLEEKAVRPLGASGPRALDVRFIASTQRDLDALVRSGEFRKDLYYRLNGVRIHLPPLRQRAADIVPLARLFSRQLPEGPLRLAPAALEALQRHAWPGNVRELITVLRRLAIDCGGATVNAADVERALGPPVTGELFPPSIFAGRGFDEVRRNLEESHLRYLHDKHAGDLERIAKELGTTTRSVYRRFERLGLKPRALR